MKTLSVVGILLSLVLLAGASTVEAAGKIGDVCQGSANDSACKINADNTYICAPSPEVNGEPQPNKCSRCDDSNTSLRCGTGAVCDKGTGICVYHNNPIGGGGETTNTSGNNSASGGSTGGGLVNPLKTDSIMGLLTLLLALLVQVGSILLVLAIVYVGFLFVMAQGKEEKIREARGALLWTVIGGLILLGAQGIVSAIQATIDKL